MPADVNLGIDIDKKGSGDKEAAAGLELVAKAADDAADELKQLDRKLLETRAAMVAAGKDFANTGDISPFKALLKDERQLSQVRKTLTRLTEDVKTDLGNAGDRSSRSFLDRLEKGLQGGLGPVSGGFSSSLITTLVAATAAAAPAIGAAVNAAILLGVGGAGLAGGIALAAKDPLVRNAFNQLGDEIGKDLTAQSKVFVDPLLHAAQEFGDAWRTDIGPQIGKDFEVLAPVLDHLTLGVSNFARNVMPGFNASITASVPLLKDLGDNTLPKMGSAIGDFFQAIAQGGPGAQAFFRDLTTLLDLSVRQLGNVTLALSKFYELYRQPPSESWLSASGLTGAGNGLLALLEKLDGGAKKTKTSLDPLNEALRQLPKTAAEAGLGVTLAANDFATLQNAITKTATTTDQLAGQMAAKILNTTLQLDQATLGFAQSQTALSEVIKQNGKELDIHTAKGQANRSAVLGSVAANIQAYETNIQAGLSAEDAAAAYDDNTRALEKQLRQAGLTQQQVDGLIGKYRGVPDKVDTDIAINGLKEAIADLDETIRLINNLPSRRTVRVDVITSQVGGPVGVVSGGRVTRAYAFGGIYPGAATGLIADRPMLVGERTVPEAAIPAPNSRISQARADSLLGTAASWWGRRLVPAGSGGGTGSTINITVNAGMGTDGESVARQIEAVILKRIRTNPAFASAIAGASS